MIAGQRAGSGRARRRVKIDGTFYREHRLIWMWWHGEDPGELVIDHLNNDPSDNRINNLRVATVTQNAYNYASKKRPYRGVEVRQSQRGERYYVGIKHQGKQIILGTYATLEEAIEARQSAELQYWGELSDSTVK